jgi:acetyl-CoA carboxylase carboxyltransferase component
MMEKATDLVMQRRQEGSDMVGGENPALRAGFDWIKKDFVARARPVRDAEDIYEVFTDKPGQQYDVRDILTCIVDARLIPNADDNETLEPDLDEYKADYGRSIVCAYARIGGRPVGIVANQGELTEQATPGGKAGPGKSTNMPRVIYVESADKAARFIMDCNQRKIPLVFLHDTTGFMVGRDSEQAGIIRAGAKMVNAMSNCVVPKIVVIMGSSYGAGNYAMCGRAFEQFISFAWPCARCAVMGANQATGTLAMIEERSRERKGEAIDEDTHKQILDAVRASYTEQQDIRHGAARGWLDRIIAPHETRQELIAALEAARAWNYDRPYSTGVLQT